jgi:delta24(24(1))-sterol reductase
MFHEKWGFMVIFWNFAGVPFVSLWNHFWSRRYSDATVTQTYVYSVVYMASHEPEKYRFSTPVYVALFGTLLTAYYVWVARKVSYCHWGSDIVSFSWDTSMSQKSRFKMQTQGNYNYRWTFPQLPWGTITNPTYIQTTHG